MRVSEPHKELAVCNEKYVKNCTELVMAKRGIDVLDNFEAFVSLEVLWINDNNIEKLTGLDACFRIKSLYGQNNRITTVEGSLLNFTFLRELRLFNNRIQDLHATLRTLSKLHHLHDLDLFGNPLAEEENYRLHVIAAIPSLEVFDRHVITPEERIAAKKLFIRRAAPSSNNMVKDTPKHEWSGTVKMLMKEVAGIERRLKAQEEADRKKQFQISEDSFLSQNKTKAHTTTVTQINTAMDEWDLCHLRKLFRDLDPHKRGGIYTTYFTRIISEMLDRGLQLVFGDTALHEESDFSLLFTHITRTLTSAEIDQEDDDPPSKDIVIWASFSQGFNHRFIGTEKFSFFWQRLSSSAIEIRAEDYFEKARALQKRMLSMSETKEDLVKQMHQLAQKGYHLQSLQNQTLSAKPEAQIHAFSQKAPERDSIALYSYSKATDRKEDKTPGEKGQLITKYGIKDKGFQTFLRIKESRKPVKLAKETLNV
ncbi:hypothetical protein THRCLA_00834 [Thraustotheca clavata]|uniref:Uncharacterized protein n=1 Tax=Thraustotheca clavata TaxID=74557 RepID=A0A1W0AA30_9STRA|nr:hypothetical protein THRCLA_00834 [Thraustotheca clavata]